MLVAMANILQTNFDPEINFREFTGVVYSWQNSQWQTNQMFEVKRTDDLPIVGIQNSYLSGHDELHSLHKKLKCAEYPFFGWGLVIIISMYLAC